MQHGYSSPFLVKGPCTAQGTASSPAQEHSRNSNVLEWASEPAARVALAELPLHSLTRRGKQPHPSIHGQTCPEKRKNMQQQENLLCSDTTKAFLRMALCPELILLLRNQVDSSPPILLCCIKNLHNPLYSIFSKQPPSHCSFKGQANTYGMQFRAANMKTFVISH